VSNFAQDDVGFWGRVERTGNGKNESEAKAKATAKYGDPFDYVAHKMP